MATKKKIVTDKAVVDEDSEVDVELPIIQEAKEEPGKTLTVKIELTEEEIIEAKKAGYEKVIAINKVDLDRMVESTQTSFAFQNDEQIIGQVESLKEAKMVYPPLVDACLAEMKRRGLDIEELKKYFDSIEYTKPWLRM